MSTPLLVVNTQPPEKPDLREDGSLDVIEVFYTLQGEGPFAGLPAVFVRLAGCPLQCSLCDTEYTKGRQRYSYEAVTEKILAVRGAADLVVITGGEPLRQNINPLCEELTNVAMYSQIETNGIYFPGNDLLAVVVCCPKTPVVNMRLFPKIDAWKYVIEAGHVDPTDGLPTSVLGEPIRPARPPKDFRREEIYISPVDTGDPERNKANVQAAVDSCLKHGYRLNLQIHKLVNLP